MSLPTSMARHAKKSLHPDDVAVIILSHSADQYAIPLDLATKHSKFLAAEISKARQRSVLLRFIASAERPVFITLPDTSKAAWQAYQEWLFTEGSNGLPDLHPNTEVFLALTHELFALSVRLDDDAFRGAIFAALVSYQELPYLSACSRRALPLLLHTSACAIGQQDYKEGIHACEYFRMTATIALLESEHRQSTAAYAAACKCVSGTIEGGQRHSGVLQGPFMATVENFAGAAQEAWREMETGTATGMSWSAEVMQEDAGRFATSTLKRSLDEDDMGRLGEEAAGVFKRVCRRDA
ncbi:hypothetical protein LTR12_011003 [Friedmanniomyces endolithicus]|nr:hypothetical protein LTR12_011003 [Friedmanniomyces endolithicus]